MLEAPTAFAEHSQALTKDLRPANASQSPAHEPVDGAPAKQNELALRELRMMHNKPEAERTDGPEPGVGGLIRRCSSAARGAAANIHGVSRTAVHPCSVDGKAPEPTRSRPRDDCGQDRDSSGSAPTPFRLSDADDHASPPQSPAQSNALSAAPPRASAGSNDAKQAGFTFTQAGSAAARAEADHASRPQPLPRPPRRGGSYRFRSGSAGPGSGVESWALGAIAAIPSQPVPPQDPAATTSR